MGWADKRHRFVSIWRIERPVGWFSPFQEWIGNMLMMFMLLPLVLVLMLKLILKLL